MAEFYADFSGSIKVVTVKADDSFARMAHAIEHILNMMADQAGTVSDAEMLTRLDRIRRKARNSYLKVQKDRKDKNVKFATLDDLLQLPTVN